MRYRVAWLLLLLSTSLTYGQGNDLSALPPPLFEETYQPSYFFNLDFGLVRPRLKHPGDSETGDFNQKLDWTVSPRFEFGLMNRGMFNPYFGYRGIYSDASAAAYEPFLDTDYALFSSAELHAMDFGVLTEPMMLLSVIQAQWDLSIRLTVADFYNRADFGFIANEPSYFIVRARQQFVGAGPRTGLRMALPFRDTGLSLSTMADVGLQWGSYRAKASIESMVDGESSYEEETASKGGILWHTGAQIGLRYAPPQFCERLSFTAGYMYEAWFSKDLNMMSDSSVGRFDYHGPFFRMEWRY